MGACTLMQYGDLCLWLCSLKTGWLLISVEGYNKVVFALYILNEIHARRIYGTRNGVLRQDQQKAPFSKRWDRSVCGKMGLVALVHYLINRWAWTGVGLCPGQWSQDCQHKWPELPHDTYPLHSTAHPISV